MTRDPMRILTTVGLDYLADLDQHDATTVSSHWQAIRHYLETGDSVALDQFDEVEVEGRDEHGQLRRVVLETDLDEIDRQAIRGDIRFESIYDEVQ